MIYMVHKNIDTVRREIIVSCARINKEIKEKAADRNDSVYNYFQKLCKSSTEKALKWISHDATEKEARAIQYAQLVQTEINYTSTLARPLFYVTGDSVNSFDWESPAGTHSSSRVFALSDNADFNKVLTKISL